MTYFLVAYFMTAGVAHEYVLDGPFTLADCGAAIIMAPVGTFSENGAPIDFPEATAFACEVNPEA